MEVTGHLHALTALPHSKGTRDPFNRSVGGTQSQCERGIYKKNIRPYHKWNPEATLEPGFWDEY